MIWQNAIPGPRTISMAVVESISIMQQTAHQPVPTVLHICSLSRHIALKALAPAFAHNTFATKNSNYIYVNFSIDTLRLPVETTKALANPMSVIRDKFLPTINRIQRIEMYFDICYAIPMCRAMARVALFSPFGAWPSIRKWSFRGKNETRQKEVVSLMVKRARNKDEAMSAVRFQRLTDAFFMALQQAIKKHGSDAELGLDVAYCTHSLKKKGCKCL
ncbi:hypothetical protein B0O99DRAFT_622252 [Bisporella sp. PMI_857]|nr:hypothetical protein B0O99DRAFT_622252 [Bisporella sp. PMI_857]